MLVSDIIHKVWIIKVLIDSSFYVSSWFSSVYDENKTN